MNGPGLKTLSGLDLIERKERERERGDTERVPDPFASLPLIVIVLFSPNALFSPPQDKNLTK